MKLFLAIFFFHSVIPFLITAELSGASGAMFSLQGSLIAFLMTAPLVARFKTKRKPSLKRSVWEIGSWVLAVHLVSLWWNSQIPFAIGLGMPLIGGVLWLFLKGGPQ